MSDEASPQVYGRSVVLIGSFNPAILSPVWFAQVGLVPLEEAATATGVIIQPGMSQFSLEWFTCVTTRDRLQLLSSRIEADGEFRDLVTGVLNILNSTPILAVGLNHDVHVRLSSEDARQRLGHRIAPKDGMWSELFDKPLTLSLKIQARREQGPRGETNVVVEPSAQVEIGIYIGVNEHYLLKPPAEDVTKEDEVYVIYVGPDGPDMTASTESNEVLWKWGSGPTLECIESRWDEVVGHQRAIVAKVISWAD